MKGTCIGGIAPVAPSLRRSGRGYREAPAAHPRKPLLDWLQRVELIENDRYCDRILAQWGQTALGVRLRPLENQG
jgi:hypothetical protein